MAIGLATGLAFARHGAVCTLTHKWGTADEEEALRTFAKAVMETLCRYLNYRLAAEGARVNVVRSRNVRTLSLRNTFGSEFEQFARRFVRDEHYIEAEEAADVVLALCSGWLDGVSGQVLTVDRGTTFYDNFMRLFNEREQLAL